MENNNLLTQFRLVKAFVFDMDGVLTNGQLHVTDDGTELRGMNIKDGYAIALAAKQGYPIAVISGSNSDGVRIRLNRLGVNDVWMNSKNKTADLEKFFLKQQINPAEILYMGDDMPDIDAMKMCGLRCCPADAVQEIKSTATYISMFAGGEGCVRDVIEKVLKLQGKWQ